MLKDESMNFAILKVELLCLGARLDGDVDKGRKGGAGAAGGRCLILPGDISVNVPLQGGFISSSPFTLSKTANGWMLYRDGGPLMGVKLIGNPKFYGKYTSDGFPMWKVALLHGRDCLASTVYQRCYYWRLGKPCKFCAIEVSANLRLTLEVKSPSQLAETAFEAVQEGVVSHVTLTTGTPGTPDRGAILLAECARAIKERVGLPVHVQLEPPKDLRYLDMLAEAGVDTVGIHVESFDRRVLAEVCPMKGDFEGFFRAWREAVRLFGEAQVSSYIIGGLGEERRSMLEGVERLARMGVIPFLVPLRPLEGTPLGGRCPPSPGEMVALYEAVGGVLAEYGLDPGRSRAGCVRCGCCSALKEFYGV